MFKICAQAVKEQVPANTNNMMAQILQRIIFISFYQLWLDLYYIFIFIYMCDWFFQYGTPCMPKSRGGIDFFLETFKICPKLFLSPLTRFF